MVARQPGITRRVLADLVELVQAVEDARARLREAVAQSEDAMNEAAILQFELALGASPRRPQGPGRIGRSNRRVSKRGASPLARDLHSPTPSCSPRRRKDRAAS